MVFPLADTVQFNLYLCRESKDKPFYIKGHGDMDLPVNAEMVMPFKCRVTNSYISERESYLMMHVMGDLYALLSYDKIMQELSFAVLDSTKVIDITGIGNCTLQDVYAFCKPAICGRWIRHEANKNWSRVDEAESVGNTTMGTVEAICGTDSTLCQH